MAYCKLAKRDFRAQKSDLSRQVIGENSEAVDIESDYQVCGCLEVVDVVHMVGLMDISEVCKSRCEGGVAD